MHFSIRIMKFLVLVIPLAMQYVFAESRNRDSYSDEKFCILEWIIYLKRFSLIALMLYGVVLYYVPKSRSYARRACCVIIDLVANGLKFILCATESEYEKIKAKDMDDQSEPRIQELYRKTCKQASRSYRQRYIDRIDDTDHSDNKLMRKKEKKIYKKYSSNERHKRKREDSCHHQKSATKDIFSESNVLSTIDNWMTKIVEKRKDDVIGLRDILPKTNISTCGVSMKNLIEDNLKHASIENHEDNTTRNIKTRSSIACKKADSLVSEIVHKTIAEKYESICKDNDQRDNIDNLSIARVSTDIKTTDCDLLNDVSHHYTGEDYTTRTTEKQTANLCYDQTKPVLSPIISWLFGGCPKISRRYRIAEVEKEESFETTWFF
ncbi:uncharacterized protein LOC109861513 isoform X2 [Pseudomyrmex gracilis]|uniref:uncharacterized protein LOC109861513 isoform X2 n=1 Tax=Pseudomyrmex gracilis TaxID=219809 RepID=UPI0009950871|nr:uncharacterized protein LOC109861513 isoform X2 [Pseudomyrmex gracilis]